MNTAQLAAMLLTGENLLLSRDGRVIALHCRNVSLTQRLELRDTPHVSVTYSVSGVALAVAQFDMHCCLTSVSLTWAGRYTQSTHRHLDAIINACRSLGHTPAASLPSARAAAAAARTGDAGDIHINLIGVKPWPS